MDFGCDAWEVSGEYTYFRGKDTTSYSINPEGDSIQDFYTNWIPKKDNIISLFEDQVTSVSAIWESDLDILDIQLSREYYVGRCLTFKTYAGVRAAWIRQYYDFDPVVIATNTAFVDASFLTKHTTKFWGVGPLIAVDIDWKVWCGFRLFLDTFASILYTDYTTITANTTGNLNTSTDQLIINYSRGDCASFLRPHTEMTIGLGQGDHFWCNKYYFDLEVGYSANVYWDQNMFIKYLSNSTNIERMYPLENRGGNLYLHGLTLTARLDF